MPGMWSVNRKPLKETMSCEKNIKIFFNIIKLVESIFGIQLFFPKYFFLVCN